MIFEELSERHFDLIHRWFNEPHVQSFYSLRSWDKREVADKLTPYLAHEKGLEVFIALLDDRPFGYLQMYPVAQHPWPELTLASEIAQKAAGIDFFIGEKELLGVGLGRAIIRHLLANKVWPRYHYCLADPDLRNESSIKCLTRCGFLPLQKVATKDATGRSVELQLMKKILAAAKEQRKVAYGLHS